MFKKQLSIVLPPEIISDHCAPPSNSVVHFREKIKNKKMFKKIF
jgi:hypothetical protein